MLSRLNARRSLASIAQRVVRADGVRAMSHSPLPATVRSGILAARAEAVHNFARNGYAAALAAAVAAQPDSAMVPITLPAGVADLTATLPQRFQHPSGGQTMVVHSELAEMFGGDACAHHTLVMGATGGAKSTLLQQLALEYLARRTPPRGAGRPGYHAPSGRLFVHVEGVSFTAFAENTVEVTPLQGLSTRQVASALESKYEDLHNPASRYIYDYAHTPGVPHAWGSQPLIVAAESFVAAAPHTCDEVFLQDAGFAKRVLSEMPRDVFRTCAAAMGYSEKTAAVAELFHGRDLRALSRIRDALTTIMDVNKVTQGLSVAGLKGGIVSMPQLDRESLVERLVAFDADESPMIKPLLLRRVFAAADDAVNSENPDEGEQRLGYELTRTLAMPVRGFGGLPILARDAKGTLDRPGTAELRKALISMKNAPDFDFPTRYEAASTAVNACLLGPQTRAIGELFVMLRDRAKTVADVDAAIEDILTNAEAKTWAIFSGRSGSDTDTSESE